MIDWELEGSTILLDDVAVVSSASDRANSKAGTKKAENFMMKVCLIEDFRNAKLDVSAKF
jgi:hypothetical protein